MIMTMEELVGFIIRESVMRNIIRPHKGVLYFCERYHGDLNDKKQVPDDVLIEYLRNFLERSGIVIVAPDNHFYVNLANEIRYHSDDYDCSLIYASVQDYDDANGSKDVPGSF